MMIEPVPSRTDTVVSLLENGPQDVKEVYTGRKFALSLRLPHFEVAYVDAMALRMGRSRNETIAMLLEVAREAIEPRLSDAVQEEVYRAFQEKALVVSSTDGEGA